VRETKEKKKSGMLVRGYAQSCVTYASELSVALLLIASESAISLNLRLQRGERGGSGMPAAGAILSRANATYESDVIKLNALASLSLFLPLFSSLSTTASASIFAPTQRCRLLKDPRALSFLLLLAVRLIAPPDRAFGAASRTRRRRARRARRPARLQSPRPTASPADP
jgi:hypothetical protein